MKTSAHRILALAAALSFAALAFLSCEDNPADEHENLVEPRIVYVSGADQTERIGATLADPIVVKVQDILKNPLSGIPVSFSSDAAGAVCSPAHVVSDASGLASCRVQVGTAEGPFFIKAAISTDSTWVAAAAVAVECAEENPDPLCVWPAGHIFIATTGSSLRSEAGSVVIDYDPQTETITKVLETSDLLDGIGFSPRGELFVSSPGQIRKVNASTHALESYAGFDDTWRISLEPNPGSVLAGMCSVSGPVAIDCPGSPLEDIVPSSGWCCLQWAAFSANPATREQFFIWKAAASSYYLLRTVWDGREPGGYDVRAQLIVADAGATGACADSSGTVYIVFNGDDLVRKIVAVADDGAIDYNFFNFYTHGGNSQDAGQWGDVAYLEGKLYLIDKRNDRLVTISKDGDWLGEVKSTAFSRPLDESEHHAMCASPSRLCSLSPGGTSSSRR